MVKELVVSGLGVAEQRLRYVPQTLDLRLYSCKGKNRCGKYEGVEDG